MFTIYTCAMHASITCLSHAKKTTFVSISNTVEFSVHQCILQNKYNCDETTPQLYD